MAFWTIWWIIFAFSAFLLGLWHLKEWILHRLFRDPSSRWHELGLFFLELAREFGIGGIVACAVSATFEYSLRLQENLEYKERFENLQHENKQQLGELKREHKQQVAELKREHKQQQDQIAKNVYLGVFGHFLDEKLNDEIKATIFTTFLIREKLTLTFEFQGPDDGLQPAGAQRLLDLTLTVSYNLRNIGVRDTPHTISPEFVEWPTVGPKVGQFLSITVKDNNGEKLIHLEGQDITKSEGQNRSLQGIPRQGQITIKRGQAVTVEWKYKTRRRFQDKYVWVTFEPADSLKIVAKKGKGAADLEFEDPPGTAHRVRRPKRIKPKPNEGPPKDGVYTWKIEAAILPYQGIFLDWYPASKKGHKR